MSNTLHLAGTEYEINELPVRKSQEWRTRAKPILETQTNISVKAQDINAGGGEESAYHSLYGEFVNELDEYIAEIVELVLMYVPESDHEQCLDRATESEFVEAFLAIVAVAFNTSFFLAIQSGIILMSGSGSQVIGMNSPLANGVSGVTN